MNGGVEDRVLFEDAEIVVVDKPAGVIVHAAPGHETGSLAQMLAAKRPGMERAGSAQRPGVVHRLDQDTSGVMVFAKTPRAYAALRRQFEAHDRVAKTYLAVLHGAPKPAIGRVDAPVGRKPWDAKRMAVGGDDAKRAATDYRTLGRANGLALVEFRIETGRTHQIRVHAAHLGHPVVGDPLYGDAARDRRLRTKPVRTLLHAVELAFDHPVTGKRLVFSAPPPPDVVYAG
ncbi:MAG: RluA family pseudouridine synthase [Kiritimatiellae bacterium]|nr:RluA family pseudouridine synthase [Kiritimatiellia bacterium]